MDKIVKQFMLDLYYIDGENPGFNYILKFWLSLMCNDSLNHFGTNAFGFIKRFGELDNNQKIFVIKELSDYISLKIERKLKTYKI